MKKYILLSLMILLVTGCSAAKEDKGSENELIIEDQTENTTVEGQADSISGMAEENYIDYNEVCSNITIDGVTYSMPFTFDDMKGFNTADAQPSKNSGYYIASLKNQEGKMLTIEIKDTEDDPDSLNDEPITSIMASAYLFDEDGNYYYDDLEEQSVDISFNGVKLGMTLEELQKAWGGADMYQPRDAEGTAYTYMSADKKMQVQVMVDSEDHIYSIALVNHRI